MGKRQDFCWKVGGEQGEGIDSTGDIFAVTLHRLGYNIFAYRHFMSLIKGGHTHFKIRATTDIKRHHGDDTDVMIAFDQYSIDYNLKDMAPKGVIIYDERFKAAVPEDADVRLVGVPMTDMAKEAGNAIMKNMVAVGVSAAMVGLDTEDFRPLIGERFGRKGDKIIEANMDLLGRGYAYCMEKHGQLMELPKRPAAKQRPLMTGNDALALGALTAGCRLVFQYPITPATEIMYWMFKNLPEFGGAVVQAEDEIAAINMAIGANYAGVRSMTSTSGPGFSLMQEGIGLSGITETPVVLVDVQRGGPSTGLPTKTEQSDLNEIIYGSHGEFPRIVLAPSTVEDSYQIGIEAFNLADRFQCPVIIASDLFLGLSRQSIDGLDYDEIKIDRGAMVTQEELDSQERGTYKRYRVTESGITPRTIPGMPKGEFVALSNEHGEEKYEETEDPGERAVQMQKRMRKLDQFDAWDLAIRHEGAEDADLLLVGVGSNYGPIQEALEELQADAGAKVGHLHIRLLHPFPVEQVARYIARAARVLVIENNFTGQVRGLLKQHVGYHDRYESCLKYDGDPFLIEEIVTKARETLKTMAAVSRSAD
ncbi:MAG: 2-oxoacid:acceptor oxidoreductase subunit alpha [Thermaerobacterales bacterium]